MLTVFAVTGGETSNLGAMLTKSALGYLVAFVSAILLFSFVFKRATEYFHRTRGEEIPAYWVVLQWASTGFLWSQWLIQDLANIFVYLPRELSPLWLDIRRGRAAGHAGVHLLPVRRRDSEDRH